MDEFFEKELRSANDDKEETINNDPNDNIARFHTQGLAVVDDNLPTPENISQAYNNNRKNIEFGEWDDSTVYNRPSTIGRKRKVPNVSSLPADLSLVDWFLHFLPWAYTKGNVIPVGR